MVDASRHGNGGATDWSPEAGTGGEAARVGTVLAGVLMVVEGALSILQGVSALDGGAVYRPVPQYSLRFSLTSWGWIHLVVGVVVLLAGFAVFTGSRAARAVGVVTVGLVMLANFVALPYQPLWSAVLIGIGVFVVWSLCHDVGPDF